MLRLARFCSPYAPWIPIRGKIKVALIGTHQGKIVVRRLVKQNEYKHTAVRSEFVTFDLSFYVTGYECNTVSQVVLQAVFHVILQPCSQPYSKSSTSTANSIVDGGSDFLDGYGGCSPPVSIAHSAAEP